MNVSEIFIRRPIATALLMAAIFLAGLVGYELMPVAALPNVQFPTIVVTAQLPGASPTIMAETVATPLEDDFTQIPGLAQMTSSSGLGSTSITLQFDLSVDINAAAGQVQQEINAASGLLPKAMPTPPTYRETNPANRPVLIYAIHSDAMPRYQLDTYSNTVLAESLSSVPGVGQVLIAGQQLPAVTVQVNPGALASRGLSMSQVQTALTNSTLDSAKGNLEGPNQEFTLNTNDQLTDASQYRNVIIAYQNGAPVTIGDIGDVINSSQNPRTGAWFDGKPAELLLIFRTADANTVQVVDQVKSMMPSLEKSIPPSVHVDLLSDRSQDIRASVSDVRDTLLITAVLVVLVIFAFLRKPWATITPSVTVPLAIVATFGAMYLFGYSIDNLSLMALSISIGFVVDDAIVMIENISRYVEEGHSRLEAALLGAEQIGFTIISLTVSLIAVLIPLLFMGDVVGRLFREFAVTLAVTILISAVVSLTLVPMLCAKLLRHPSQESVFFRRSQEWFDATIERYGRMLTWVLDHQPLVLLVAIGTLALTIFLYVVVPKGFFPVQDTGLIAGITEADQSVSYDAMAERQQALAAAILKDPDVQSLSSIIGVDGTNATLNSGRFLINLKPLGQRKASASDIIRRLKQETAEIAGIALYMQPVQDLTIDTTVSRTQYQFVLEDANPTELATWVPKLTDKLQQLPELEEVANNVEAHGLAADIVIDRDTAARFGITPATVDNALYDAFAQRIVSTIFTQSNQYRVILEASAAEQRTLDTFNAIYLPSSLSPTGQVRLSAIAHLELRDAPLEIDHLGQFPSATISFNLAPNASLGEAVDAIKATEKAMGLPQSLFSTFEGAALAFQASLKNELLLILAAIIAVYIVLGVLYESYIHPITILSTLPSAGIGALLALLIDGSDLGVIGIIGIVLLIGIVKKNAIMMIDFALEAEREHGKSPREAIYQASLLRFRPILMTTLAALFGALPLMLGTGTGSELRHPLGVTIVGGLIVSQMLTLFTTPVIYLAFDRLARRFRGPQPVESPAE